MILNEYFYKFLYFKNKTLYLILLLPISLFIGSTITNLFIILIIILFILESVQKKYYFFLEKDFYILFAFFIYIILNSIYLTQTSDGIIRAVGFIRFPLLAYAIAYYFSLENGRYQNRIINLWFIIFMITSFDIIFEFFIGFNFIGNTSNYAGRLASFSGDELKIGGYYFGFMLISIWIVLKNHKKYYFFFIILFLLSSLLIGEKANFIKSLFIVSTFLIFIDKNSILKKLSLIGLFVVFAFIFIKSTPAFNSRFIHHIFNKTEITNYKSLISSNQHLSHYNTAFEIFKKNPIFGIGIKNFRNESGDKKYDDLDHFHNTARFANHPHEIYYEFLSETGIFGFTCFIIFFLISISISIKNYLNYKNLYQLSGIIFVIDSLIPILPSGSFLSTYTSSIFWLNYALMMGYNIKK